MPLAHAINIQDSNLNFPDSRDNKYLQKFLAGTGAASTDRGYKSQTSVHKSTSKNSRSPPRGREFKLPYDDSYALDVHVENKNQKTMKKDIVRRYKYDGLQANGFTMKQLK